ncbi:MAG: phosphoribosylamine--glycine ligase [Flavobacteriales bacterium]|jgi:phosphoribosylamine--glycine ligase|nr:phosphoribosylamine--glycine ligase [Flavobacteriales bacterium]MBP6643494.1 phosphoribosylamine--glycine ligase [Flavobacteriales bacterium]MBP7156462.1 phosphoribosylamine--glycine ligase [Flavobacteriales bacterium]HQV75883.1 phosphoribosylamine--glycine ligase [Flavobacteriales bacterium]
MNVLLIGSGGREHAMAWKIAQSSLLDELYVAPGNPGTVRHGRNVDLDLNDQKALRTFLKEKKIRIVVVGPEGPLVDGLHDRIADDPLLKGEVTVIGPRAKGAQLEGSKDFAKDFMFRHNIPTAAYRSFGKGELKQAIDHLGQMQAPYVIKADGLANGKGVVITSDIKEATRTLKEMLEGGRFGSAGERVVLEQFLKGVELSAFLITDGVSFKMLPAAKDYKRIGAGDTGPNTGGMGAVSPVYYADKDFMQKVHDRVAAPTIRGLQKDGIPYSGFLFMGLMNVNNEPYVIEYNVRLGDPETQAILPRLRSDLLDLFEGISSGTLSERHVDVDDRTAVTVVLANQGYPGKFETGHPIIGIDLVTNAYVFQSGTAMQGDRLVTNGGRVLSVTAFGKDIEQAILAAHRSASPIEYEGKYLRVDIGLDAVKKPAVRATPQSIK